MTRFEEKVVFLETIEAEQKKELESHTDLMLKMEQERLLLSKEAEQAKAEKLQC